MNWSRLRNAPRNEGVRVRVRASACRSGATTASTRAGSPTARASPCVECFRPVRRPRRRVTQTSRTPSSRGRCLDWDGAGRTVRRRQRTRTSRNEAASPLARMIVPQAGVSRQPPAAALAPRRSVPVEGPVLAAAHLRPGVTGHLRAGLVVEDRLDERHDDHAVRAGRPRRRRRRRGPRSAGTRAGAGGAGARGPRSAAAATR
jgi:hypothetical protein